MYEGITFRGKAYRVNLLYVTAFLIGTLVTAFSLGKRRG